jgi:hypothetical protein
LAAKSAFFGLRLLVLGEVIFGLFTGFLADIQIKTSLYAVESGKAGNRGFRPSAGILQHIFEVFLQNLRTSEKNAIFSTSSRNW